MKNKGGMDMTIGSPARLGSRFDNQCGYYHFGNWKPKVQNGEG